MSTPTTKRGRIVNKVLELLNDLVEGDVVPWKFVAKTPLEGVKSRVVCPALSVFDIQEKIIEANDGKREIVKAQVSVLVEFWLELKRSDDASTELNFVLGHIQRVLGGEATLGGLAQEIREFGSKFKMEAEPNRIISGEVIFNVNYIRKTAEPFG